MKLEYRVICDCGKKMNIEEAEYIEDLDCVKQVHVCPRCHKATIVMRNNCGVTVVKEDEDVYEEYPD